MNAGLPLADERHEIYLAEREKMSEADKKKEMEEGFASAMGWLRTGLME